MGGLIATDKETEREIISDLKRSASVVGKLYPVLVDKSGEVIDGRHRLKADPNWFKVQVTDVECEEDRLLARLVSNVCRRNVPFEEKTQMLEELGQVYAEQGVPHRELIKRIVEKTGMSYRWVMKYASKDLKVRPGLGGPYKRKVVPEIEVVRHATGDDELFMEPAERVATLTNYSNTNFATILVEKRFYLKLKEVAAELGIGVDVIINNALLSMFQKANKLAKRTCSVDLLPAK